MFIINNIKFNKFKKINNIIYFLLKYKYKKEKIYYNILIFLNQSYINPVIPSAK